MDLDNSKNVLLELLAILIGAIAGGIFFILLLNYDSKSDSNTNVTSDIKIEENIKPVAKVELAAQIGSNASGVEKSGEQVYKAVCSACHQTGVLNAPKFGDSTSWAPRISQGYEMLVQHSIKGIRSMPAKGGNPSLSDNEIANTVLYMTNSSGASFKK